MNGVFVNKESLILPLSVLYLNPQNNYGIYTKLMCLISAVLSLELLFINVVNMTASTLSFLIIVSLPIFISQTTLIFNVNVYNTIYSLVIELKKSKPITFILIYGIGLFFLCTHSYIMCYYFAFYCCALCFTIVNYTTFNIFTKITSYFGEDIKLALFICAYLAAYYFLFMFWGVLSDLVIVLLFAILGANGFILSFLRLVNNDLEVLERIYSGTFGSISTGILVLAGLAVTFILQVRKKTKKKLEEEV